MYAEELCFAPKYERARKLVNEGAIGTIYHMRQCEKHSGPHSDWFYDLNRSGGGAVMDMGCHGLAWFRWMLGGQPRALSVYAHMQTGLMHKGRTRCEENAICVVEFEGGAIGVVENSWAKLGGMEDRVEIYGTGGVIYADLFMGNSALTYSDKGLRVRHGKGRFDTGLDLHHVRGSIQPGLSARAETLHRLRARRHAAGSSPVKTAALCSK